jgi:hypothetical protein
VDDSDQLIVIDLPGVDGAVNGINYALLKFLAFSAVAVHRHVLSQDEYQRNREELYKLALLLDEQGNPAEEEEWDDIDRHPTGRRPRTLQPADDLDPEPLDPEPVF